MNLDGVVMSVQSTAEQGVVGAGTRLRFLQKGTRVFARYSGGSIARGCLVGAIAGDSLRFRYVQQEVSGGLHAGRSVCALTVLEDGRLRIVEHFVWSTRPGSGTNVFDEVAG